ncbi:MAG TPA: single-stranded DNA-binding protein [Pseudolysinimonas sp.]|nr:single-stranded DNA-binding protein [Pseudolysinimonas sp.]
MTDSITLTGLVATTPRHLVTSEGLPITSFRLASTQRRYDRGAQKWIDGETNWYTVTAFRQLAVNVVGSVNKGQRVVVSGKLRVRDWESGDRAGTTVEVDADALGHDLAWGTSVFTRSVASTVANDADLPSDRAAVLDDDESGSADPSSSAEAPAASASSDSPDQGEPDDELAVARAKRPAEVALPF